MMGCKYHEERYQEEGYVNRSDMAAKLLEQMEAMGFEIEKQGPDMPERSSGIEPSKKLFRINEPCAGCAVLHILHGMAILDEDEERKGVPTRYEMDNVAYRISRKLGLGLDKEEWLHWCAAQKPSDETIACLDDSDQIWKRREQVVNEVVDAGGWQANVDNKTSSPVSLCYDDFELINDELGKYGSVIELGESVESIARKIIDMTMAIIRERDIYAMLLDGAICEHGKDNRLELGEFMYNHGEHCELKFERFKDEDEMCKMAISRKVVGDEVE